MKFLIISSPLLHFLLHLQLCLYLNTLMIFLFNDPTKFLIKLTFICLFIFYPLSLMLFDTNIIDFVTQVIINNKLSEQKEDETKILAE